MSEPSTELYHCKLCATDSYSLSYVIEHVMQFHARTGYEGYLICPICAWRTPDKKHPHSERFPQLRVHLKDHYEDIELQQKGTGTVQSHLTSDSTTGQQYIRYRVVVPPQQQEEPKMFYTEINENAEAVHIDRSKVSTDLDDAITNVEGVIGQLRAERRRQFIAKLDEMLDLQGTISHVNIDLRDGNPLLSRYYVNEPWSGVYAGELDGCLRELKSWRDELRLIPSDDEVFVHTSYAGRLAHNLRLANAPQSNETGEELF